MENKLKHGEFMTMNIVSDELKHYGRKGMKWGQNIFGKNKTRPYHKTYTDTQLGYNGSKKSKWYDAATKQHQKLKYDTSISEVESYTSVGKKAVDSTKLDIPFKEAVKNKQKLDDIRKTYEEDFKSNIKNETTNSTNNNGNVKQDTEQSRRKTIDNLNDASRIASGVDKISSDGRKLNNIIARNKNTKKTSQELDDMDNQQLKSKVERLELEQRYKNVTQNNVSKGHAAVDTALAIVGTVGAIASTALTVGSVIEMIRGRK